MFTEALFTIAKTWKPRTGPSTDEKDVIPKYNGSILSHKNESNIAIFGNMDDLEIVILSEVSQTKTNTTVYCSQVQSNFLK